MIDLAQDLSPILAMVIGSAAAWYARSQAAARTTDRVRRLNEAADLLDLHARSLERFLDDKAAPVELKRLLLDFSDIMGEREAVVRLAEWASTRPFEEPIDTEETRVISEAVANLRSHRLDLVERFDAAIITAVAGASLRWPESAALFEAAFPRLVTTPKRDVAIAVTVTRLRTGMPFSLRPPLATSA
jgi:hypothetical protein